MDKPTLVLIAYNRPDAFHGLLQSVAGASYPVGVNLVISIDGNGHPKVKQLAENFQWNFGEKILINNPKNLGLKKHVLSCGNLTQKYGTVIMLEDDLEVSSQFYQYALQVLHFYQAEENLLAGFSLYNYQIAETALLPKYTLAEDKNPVYLMQYPSSWGQMFTPAQWQNFTDWNKKQQSTQIGLPGYVQSWSAGSWKKDLIAYLIHQQKYFLYPVQSYTTNMGYKGVNLSINMDLFQVPLAASLPTDLPSLDKLVRYDAYFELEANGLIPTLGDQQVVIDIYGTKPLPTDTSLKVLSSKPCTSAHGQKMDLDTLPLLGVPNMELHVAPVAAFDNVVKVPLVEEALYQHGIKAGSIQPGAFHRFVFIFSYRFLNYYKAFMKALRGK